MQLHCCAFMNIVSSERSLNMTLFDLHCNVECTTEIMPYLGHSLFIAGVLRQLSLYMVSLSASCPTQNLGGRGISVFGICLKPVKNGWLC